MGALYDEDDEEEFELTLTEEESQRLTKWVIDHGHTKEEAYEALAYVMGATAD
jgi:hypothetical protein